MTLYYELNYHRGSVAEGAQFDYTGVLYTGISRIWQDNFRANSIRGNRDIYSSKTIQPFNLRIKYVV